ncbi:MULTISPECIES: hypothetical protein [Pseudoalteromonas]|uniref:Uncharacterized protein n=1 Tax=Pseudoalteromonas luteoviolacea (strain 2ta16) TaxID=1353533 RepID=V4HKV4_PSEL2|nr:MULTISPECIES: hypothetical protein [Pseudoalteromonas]ESP91445.1 hypothetical protein PL2TA16_00244 [Pseudoalteromonas luteoviolacea 2ta16]KZN40095.1 hypothetical protein N483_18070 [Pseudoalteromonas luteoviolacea NCIMB 1944]MCG7551215.1 hypothetical protein [Pseudoalteromonas sp. Of7M-16]
MKYILLLLLISPCISIANQILTPKEVFESEQPIYWKIDKKVSIRESVFATIKFEFSQKGNGSVKVRDGLWVRVFDCHDNGFLYSPCLMRQRLKDINSDGYNDIVFEADLIDTGEKESDPKTNKGRVFVELLYSPEHRAFKLGNYSDSIEPYQYYEK